MRHAKYIVLFLMIVSCSNDDNVSLDSTTLATYIFNKSIETGGVIACAASDMESNDVLVFYYPEIGATNIKLFETQNSDQDHEEFSNYFERISNPLPVFNGYLEKHVTTFDTEKWVIVTFELDNEIKISNPIRIKHTEKPTVWTDNVLISQTQIGMSNFTWTDNPNGDNAIYFQVITDAQNNLLSGTYTYDNYFQYYNTTNVVLNITQQTPPNLISGQSYNFTLMDVSLDNWVNTVIQKSFLH